MGRVWCASVNCKLVRAFSVHHIDPGSAQQETPCTYQAPTKKPSHSLSQPLSELHCEQRGYVSSPRRDEEEETEEQRYQRFFGPAESSTEDDESSDEEEAPPAPRLAIESEASALLAKLIGEVLAEAKTRPERETARLACAAAGSFLAQIPGAAGAFEGEASREDVLAEGPSATLCVARGARFKALDDLNDALPPPVDAGATWACLVGRPWPATSDAARARPALRAGRAPRRRRPRDRRSFERARETGRPAGAVGALPLRRRARPLRRRHERGAGPRLGRRRRVGHAGRAGRAPRRRRAARYRR